MTRTKKLFSSNRKGMDMTEGKIVPLLIAFALPLFLGNAFQQLYNTVDAWVVGNFVSNEAFSAIGTISPITTFIVGFFSGFSGGATIVIAQYFGAKRYEDVNRAVHTSIALVLVSCIFITAAGLSLSPSLLRLMKTPDSVFEDAKIYLMIYFIGSSAMMIYNIGAGILRAIGDSRRPFIFLVISALINLVFDLIFVLVFDLGVAGVAIATMVAQIISAVLLLIDVHLTSIYPFPLETSTLPRENRRVAQAIAFSLFMSHNKKGAVIAHSSLNLFQGIEFVVQICELCRADRRITRRQIII